MRSGVSFSRGKAPPMHEAGHSFPSSAEVNSVWGYTSTPPWRGAQLRRAQEQLYLFMSYEGNIGEIQTYMRGQYWSGS